MYEPGSYELVPHDTMRRVIAERLTLAKQTIPHFYLSIDCRLDALLKARKRLNAMTPQDGPRAFRISVNDFIIKALAMALQQTPRANATWTEEGILLHRGSDIAVAVALPGGGLFTPVVRNAELKSLSEISNEMRDLATRARSKRLAPHEYQGGTTAISNLGMYGIAQFDAVINPPQASILAVGKAEKRPIVKKDKLKIATMMSVTLSVDHRVIDGALGAELLAGLQGLYRRPGDYAGVMVGHTTFRPAVKADASALAVLVDIAGEGSAGAFVEHAESAGAIDPRGRARARHTGEGRLLLSQCRGRGGRWRDRRLSRRLPARRSLRSRRPRTGSSARAASGVARSESARLLVRQCARDLP